MKNTNIIDIEVQNEGSIFLLRPCTPAAKDWIAGNIGDEAQFFGNAVVVEHRFVMDVVRGMVADGLAVR